MHLIFRKIRHVFVSVRDYTLVCHVNWRCEAQRHRRSGSTYRIIGGQQLPKHTCPNECNNRGLGGLFPRLCFRFFFFCMGGRDVSLARVCDAATAFLRNLVEFCLPNVLWLRFLFAISCVVLPRARIILFHLPFFSGSCAALLLFVCCPFFGGVLPAVPRPP